MKLRVHFTNRSQLTIEVETLTGAIDKLEGSGTMIVSAIGPNSNANPVVVFGRNVTFIEVLPSGWSGGLS